jgi:hypothetical protein
MSMDSAFSASISEGPALKVDALILVPPSSFWSRPSWTPTSAVAWVRLGK